MSVRSAHITYGIGTRGNRYSKEKGKRTGVRYVMHAVYRFRCWRNVTSTRQDAGQHRDGQGGMLHGRAVPREGSPYRFRSLSEMMLIGQCPAVCLMDYLLSGTFLSENVLSYRIYSMSHPVRVVPLIASKHVNSRRDPD